MKPFFGRCGVVCKWWLDPVGPGEDLPPGAVRVAEDEGS